MTITLSNLQLVVMGTIPLATFSIGMISSAWMEKPSGIGYIPEEQQITLRRERRRIGALPVPVPGKP
jgi:hypothetical protein